MPDTDSENSYDVDHDDEYLDPAWCIAEREKYLQEQRYKIYYNAREFLPR